MTQEILSTTSHKIEVELRAMIIYSLVGSTNYSMAAAIEDHKEDIKQIAI